jgi:GPH family glycoside/pentoside/hexuronide:cation symporter
MQQETSPQSVQEPVAEQSLYAARKSPAFYGLGVLSINILLESFSAYAYFFYIEVLGLAMTMAAIVKMVYAIWNSANDPIFGFLSDNTRSRWGRRHTWLVPAMILAAIAYVLIFSVPHWARTGTDLFWYMLWILLLFETLTTILIANYVALFPEYFHTLQERSNASVYYQAGKIIAVFIGLALTPLVYGAIGFSRMALLYAVLAVGGLAFALSVNREDPQMQAAEKVNFLPAFKNVLRDGSFWKFGMAFMLVTFGVNMVPFGLPFYVKYALHAGPEYTSILSAGALVTCFLVLPLWGKLVRKWRMKSTFSFVVLIMALGTAMMSLRPSIGLAVSAIAVIGVAWGGLWICNNIIRADLVSQHLARTGKHTEALYYALLNVILSMGGVLQAGAIFLASVLFGYVSGENPGPQPDMAFRFMMGFAPLAVLALSLYFIRSFFKDYSEAASA